MMDDMSMSEQEPEEMEIFESEQGLAVVEDTLDTFLEAATVDAVYGEPVENGDFMIIPAAEVISGLGFGVGSGYGSGDNNEGQSGTGGGSGGGGGGKILARPVAVVIASPEGVRVEPVVDVTKIALAALTAGGFMAAMFLRMINPGKALKEMKS